MKLAYTPELQYSLNDLNTALRKFTYASPNTVVKSMVTCELCGDQVSTLRSYRRTQRNSKFEYLDKIKHFCSSECYMIHEGISE